MKGVMYMDIDNNLIKGLGANPEEISKKPEIENIDVEIPTEVGIDSSETIVTTSDEAIDDSQVLKENLSTVVETEENVPSDEKNNESIAEKGNKSDFSSDVLASISENVSQLISEVAGIKTSLAKLDGYDKAVETLKRSLAANQRNEDNIYKELETYKKNQYFNYIRPFLEFLINILTDMLNLKKQYEDDKENFVSQHGQEVYDEIIDLNDYYLHQIENQLQIQGVEIIHYESESAFVATEQTISKVILTDDDSLVGIVGKVDSACYKFEDKVLKKAKVQVYKRKPFKNK